ncbi:hypothetical protein [Pseudomonas peli]|uniref:hypothetical protein n=1 Tax=Pseudomonas peli TaxID=592361 RepID=UPI003D156BC1
MQYLAEKMGGKGNLAVILGRLAHSDNRQAHQWGQGCIGAVPGDQDRRRAIRRLAAGKGMDLMNEWLTKGQTINAVASNNDEMGIGAAMALRQAGAMTAWGRYRRHPGRAACLEKGQLSVSVFRTRWPSAPGSPAAVKLVNHEALQGDLWVPTQLVTPENYAQFQP